MLLLLWRKKKIEVSQFRFERNIFARLLEKNIEHISCEIVVEDMHLTETMICLSNMKERERERERERESAREREREL